MKSTLNGILRIDKPLGPSSMKAVACVRATLGTKKAGHSGTLDPQASGLLLMVFGNATRVLPYFNLEPKVYCFGIRFGMSTDTLDAAGTIVQHGGPIPSLAQLDETLTVFTGEIEQTPPHFSALKVGGVRAYKLARAQKDFELPVRRVRIHSAALQRYDERSGEAIVTVACSGGTYIRSLARDIAAHQGTFGYASDIRRISMGSYSVEGALRPDATQSDLLSTLIPLRTALASQPSYHATSEQMEELRHGRDIRITEGQPGQEFVFIFDEHDELAAIVQNIGDEIFHPIRVFIQS